MKAMFFQHPQLITAVQDVYITRRIRTVVDEPGRKGGCIGYRVNGESTFTDENKTIRVRKGDLLFTPPGVPYQYRAEDEEIIIVHLLLPETEKWDFDLVHFWDTAEAVQKFRKLLNVWNEEKPGFQLRANGILYDILADVREQASRHSVIRDSREKNLLQALEYLHRNYYRSELCIEDIAAASNISGTYLRKLFQKYRGISPLKYISNLRIKKAMELLRADDTPVSVIASTVGFSDPLYFSRVFKNATGQSPTEFRAQQGWEKVL